MQQEKEWPFLTSCDVEIRLEHSAVGKIVELSKHAVSPNGFYCKALDLRWTQGEAGSSEAGGNRGVPETLKGEEKKVLEATRKERKMKMERTTTANLGCFFVPKDSFVRTQTQCSLCVQGQL